MTAYPSLNRWLAAALTVLLIGGAIAFWLTRGDMPNPIGPNPAVAGEPKASADWVMYGGSPARNMANTSAKGLPIEWDIDAKKPVNIKWVADLGSKAYGGPTIAGGRVFIGTNNQKPRDLKLVKPKLDKQGKQFVDKKGNPVSEPIDLGIIMSFEETTGKFQWQSTFEKLPGGQVVDWPYEGICSSPHVEGERMYFVSNRCEVVCADVKTGKSHWKLDMITELGVFPHNISDCSPLLVGDALWVVTSNGVNEDHINVPAPKAPSFIKVDKSNGKVLWQDNTPTAALLEEAKGGLEDKNFFKRLVNRGRLIQHGQWANAAYGVVKGQPQVIFPGGDGWIYSFDPQGKLIWKFDCNPKDAKYELQGKGTRNDFIATPVIYKDRVYIGVGQDPEHNTGVGHLWCIDMTKKGDVSPELVTDDKVFPPKTKKNPDSALVWHYGGIITDPDLQDKLGRNYYFGRTMSTCAIHEDIVYASDLSGVLHCLDANTGKVHWESNAEAQTWSSPYYADGKVYFGTDAKAVHVYQHGTKLKKLAENDMGGKVRATPVAANGVLYVMTENKLYAIQAK
ncbi:MAG: PQQ-binding-like beta-propeller repeat protein [Planctomycetes bacterium]|nr:PQQ-binding-like beta-propeller repeat protein [Planctomycetota bacterium]